MLVPEKVLLLMRSVDDAAFAFVLIHVPFTEKQPDVRLMPLPKVDDAFAETLSGPLIVVEPVLDTIKSVVVAVGVEEEITNANG
jgi:hypothetical protein